MDSNVRALGIVAHAATSFHPVIDGLIAARLLLILTDLNSVNSLHICGDNRHADCHVTGVDISIFDRFHYIRISRNDLLTGLVLHFF